MGEAIITRRGGGGGISISSEEIFYINSNVTDSIKEIIRKNLK